MFFSTCNDPVSIECWRNKRQAKSTMHTIFTTGQWLISHFQKFYCNPSYISGIIPVFSVALCVQPVVQFSLSISTCIELIIANKSEYFQNSTVIETGSSDFHKMTFTDMKVFCSKYKVNIIQ